jgi:cytochrome c oxidase subunit 2
MRRRPVLTMVVVGFIATAALLTAALSIQWFPPAASTRAHEIHTFFDVLLVVSVPIFVLVATVVITAVIRFRMRPGQEDMDGAPIHGNTMLETVWTAVPATLILGLCAYAYVVLNHIEEPPGRGAPPELQVGVMGRQFDWRFTYPQQITHGRPLTTTELWLPAGRSVRFSIRSADVIHSFWVPSFAAKEDAVPGIVTHYRVTPDRLGSYPVVCAELCGFGHSVMRSTVHVVTGPQFSAWLRRELAPARASPAGPQQLATLGKQTFTGPGGCDACHTLADAGTSGRIGPNLDRGLKGRSPGFIRQSIVAPNAVITAGYPRGVMPADFARTLSPAQLDGLVAYLARATR